MFNLVEHIKRANIFSLKTFGPGDGTHSVIAHIRSELLEIERDPKDLMEWVDVIILALDGAARSGHSAEEIVAAIEAKQTINENRTWPDWRTVPEGQPIEHDRTKDVKVCADCRATGAIHCSDPANCGGPWDDHR